MRGFFFALKEETKPFNMGFNKKNCWPALLQKGYFGSSVRLNQLC